MLGTLDRVWDPVGMDNKPPRPTEFHRGYVGFRVLSLRGLLTWEGIILSRVTRKI